MHQQESWGLLEPNELRKVAGHRANVSRNQRTSSIGCDPKNLRVGSAVRDNTSGRAKIDGRLAAP
jgi:hypothetical protein